MNIDIPQELEVLLLVTSRDLNISVDRLVQQILAQYFAPSSELLDEFAAWQEVSEEALKLVDDIAI